MLCIKRILRSVVKQLKNIYYELNLFKVTTKLYSNILENKMFLKLIKLSLKHVKTE